MTKSLGVEFFTVDLPNPVFLESNETNFQNWARQSRRQFFREIADRHHAVICLGHHLDDVAETVLARLCRGTAPHNLAGMRRFDAPFWRPLLHLRKSHLAELAASEGWAFGADVTNSDQHYERNFLRAAILPQLESMRPGASEKIAKIAEEMAEISRYARSTLPIESDDRLQASMPMEFFVHLPAAMQRDGLAALRARCLPTTAQWSRAYLKELLAELERIYENNLNSLLPVRGGGCFSVEGGKLLFLVHTPSSKINRAIQHWRSRMRRDQKFAIGPNANCTIYRAGFKQPYRLESTSDNRVQIFSLEPVSPSEASQLSGKQLGISEKNKRKGPDLGFHKVLVDGKLSCLSGGTGLLESEDTDEAEVAT